MTELTLKLVKYGNSSVICFPKTVLKQAGKFIISFFQFLVQNNSYVVIIYNYVLATKPSATGRLTTTDDFF